MAKYDILGQTARYQPALKNLWNIGFLQLGTITADKKLPTSKIAMKGQPTQNHQSAIVLYLSAYIQQLCVRVNISRCVIFDSLHTSIM